MNKHIKIRLYKSNKSTHHKNLSTFSELQTKKFSLVIFFFVIFLIIVSLNYCFLALIHLGILESEVRNLKSALIIGGGGVLNMR